MILFKCISFRKFEKKYGRCQSYSEITHNAALYNKTSRLLMIVSVESLNHTVLKMTVLISPKKYMRESKYID